MITIEDYEYLKSLPHLGKIFNVLDLSKVWYTSDETLITVARILNECTIFQSIDNAIDFFESPRKWTKSIQDLISEYEKDKQIEEGQNALR